MFNCSDRINSTREMCNALKEHVFKVEQAVELGESDRKKLMEEDAQTQQQYMVGTVLLCFIEEICLC